LESIRSGRTPLDAQPIICAESRPCILSAEQHRRIGHQTVQTILIVDDEWALAEVLSAILRDEGYRTLVAGMVAKPKRC
jgi:arylsulfatase A-like enzyme